MSVSGLEKLPFAMPISLEQFLRQLADSKLMSAGEVAALIAHLPVEARPETGDQF